MGAGQPSSYTVGGVLLHITVAYYMYVVAVPQEHVFHGGFETSHPKHDARSFTFIHGVNALKSPSGNNHSSASALDTL